MNIVLTTRCSKNCSFCFADDFIKNPKEEIMELEFAKTLISEAFDLSDDNKSVRFDKFQLLGGEPTQYKYFKELMRWLIDITKERKRNNLPASRLSLISNFLFKDEEIGGLIKEYSEIGTGFSMLLNSSEFKSSKQLELFTDNLIKYSTNSKANSISLGFTMFSSTTFNEYKLILDYLYERFVSTGDKIYVPSIRLSMPNPVAGSVSFESVLKNKDVYQKLMNNFIDWSLKHKLKINFDCGLFYCLFDDRLRHYADTWTEGSSKYGCESGAYDIFPNGDVINCYPTSEIFKVNYHKYRDFSTTICEVNNKKKLFVAIDDIRPAPCVGCSHYMVECKGPCLGYYGKPEDNFKDILMN